MQLRVGDDADRMRARGQRDQPDPVAGADQVVGREPARRRLAARAPGGVVGPVVDRRCASSMRNQTALASCAFGSARPSLRLSRPARPQASTSQRARDRVALAAVRASRRGAAPRVLGQLDVAHQRAVDEAHAAPRRLLGQEVLEDAAVDLVARHRAGSGWRRSRSPGRCRAGLPRRRSGSRTCLQLRARRRCGFEAEHRVEVVGADLDRRLADLVRGVAAPDGARRSSTRTSRSAKRCFSCSASVRPARPPPMMTTSCGARGRRPWRSWRQPCGCSRSAQRQRAPTAAGRSALPASPRASASKQRQRVGHRVAGQRARGRRSAAPARAPAPRAERPVERRPRVRSLALAARAPAPRRAGRGCRSPTPARRPPATSKATSSTGRSSAAHCAAASSRPAAKLASKAVSALLAAMQPVPMVQ